MSRWRGPLALVPLLAALPAAAADQAGGRSIDRLVEEAAAASDELARLRAEAQAERSRALQAGVLGDPSLGLGLQNDGFRRLAIGSAETSFWSISITQPLPWPGKRELRRQVAAIEPERAEARLGRARLGLEARVRREAVALLLARAQLGLLDEAQRLWAEAEAAARTRYESGQAPQSDLLRAQLERARLEQRRWSAEADEAQRLAGLNRLRALPLDQPLPLEPRLGELPAPPLPAEEQAQAAAAARSPELQLARLSVAEAAQRTALARSEERPDLAVSAALMPRGGLEPMWSLGLSIGLPIFSSARTAHAVEEGEQRRAAEGHGVAQVVRLLQLRTHERLLALQALRRIDEQYRRLTLLLSAAAARATMLDYQSGRASFAAVLEALAGSLADRVGAANAAAEAQLQAIALDEAALDPTERLAGTTEAAAIPGAAATGAGRSGRSGGAEGSGGTTGSSGPQPGMGGM
jgi:outer membrane protein TolC